MTDADLHSTAIQILIVTDGSDESAHATAVAAELFPSSAIEIMTTMPPTRSVYAGTTGFAGPVLGDDELGELERSRTVEAMGTNAATARALGARPARLTMGRGEPLDAVLEVARRGDPDVVVIASTGRGSPESTRELISDLLARLGRPLLVVPPTQPESSAKSEV